MHFKNSDLDTMPKRYRANLINALTGAKSANIIGTCNKEGLSNAAIFSSAVHIGADPALIGIISRPNTVARHTLENIQSTGEFTLNHVTKPIYKQAHLTSARTEESEFSLSGLKEEFIDGFNAPFVAQSIVKIGLKWVRTIDIKENGTHFIIGTVQHIFLPDGCLSEDGDIDISKLGSIAITGLFTYNELKKISKEPYAKL